jgi:hypothetical protein
VRELLKSHPFIISIPLTILPLGIGWGLSMLLPSTVHNGISIIVLTIVVMAPFLVWDYTLFKKLGSKAFPKKGGKKVIFYVGVLLLIVGSAMILTQMNFRGGTTFEDTPKNYPTSEFPTFMDGRQELTLLLGMMRMKSTVSDLMKEPHYLTIDSYQLVSLYVDNHRLYADTVLYGGDKLPFVELKQNILVSEPQGWDLNFDSSSIEVVDERQNPVFQLIYKTQYLIVINGFLYFPGGFMFVNEDGRTIMNPPTPADYSMNRLFQYPSSLYQGQRITP